MSSGTEQGCTKLWEKIEEMYLFYAGVESDEEWEEHLERRIEFLQDGHEFCKEAIRSVAAGEGVPDERGCVFLSDHLKRQQDNWIKCGKDPRPTYFYMFGRPQ